MHISGYGVLSDGVSGRSPFMRLVFVLCVFAIFGAQVSGSVARFVCDCGGVLKVVAASACDGPHGLECHSDDAHEGDGSHGGSSEGEHKHHEQESEELAATTALAPHIVVPSPIVLAILPDFSFFSPEASLAPLLYFPKAFGGPPPDIAVARTFVLRI